MKLVQNIKKMKLIKIQGRGNESDIRIADISVSRVHAIVKLDKTGFYLEDCNSKFGTLLYAKQPIQLTGENNNICV